MTAHYVDGKHPRVVAVVLIALALIVGCERAAPTTSRPGLAPTPVSEAMPPGATPVPPAVTSGPLTPTTTGSIPGTPRPTAAHLPYLTGSGGGVIAFGTNRDGNYEIYVMNADGSDPLRLTKNWAHDSIPNWSPDGTQIAFASNRTGNWDIYVMNARDALQGIGNSSLQRLTNDPAGDFCPAWSPNGTQMAFVSTRDGNHEIYVMNVDGTDPRRLTTDDAEDWCPAWSPDGTRIAFYSHRDGNQEIYVVNTDGSDLQRLTHNDADDFHPTWSPAPPGGGTSGTQIAFISGRDGSGNVYLMNPDGSNPRRLTNTRVGDESPTWSSDGTRIAFASEHDGDGEIYVVDVQDALRSEGADVSDLQRLTSNHVGDYCPAWRPHGNHGGP